MASTQGHDAQSTGSQQESSGSVANELILSELRSALPDILEHHPVSLAYLYGSVVTGRAGPFSDVDIALVTSEDLSPLDRLKLILHIQLELTDVCDILNADVRIINDAPLVFRGRVVTDGVPVYARNENERVEFEVTTRMRYFDYLPIHRQLQDAFFADVRKRGLHGRSRQE